MSSHIYVFGMLVSCQTNNRPCGGFFVSVIDIVVALMYNNFILFRECKMLDKQDLDLMKHAIDAVGDPTNAKPIKHAPIIVGLSHDAGISALALMEAAKNIGTEIIVVSSKEELKEARQNLGLPCGDVDLSNERDMFEDLARHIMPPEMHQTEGISLLADHHFNMKTGTNLTQDYSARGGNRKKGKTKWPRRN